MCGVIGYWCPEGFGEAFSVIVDSLKKLEYRGYDSFGIATINRSVLGVVRAVGKVSDSKCLPLGGSVGMGHTRWATHGGVSEKNSHPHRDCNNRLAVVHNGIIENFQELRIALELRGHILRSDTDTEVLPHLLEEALNLGMSIKDSVISVSKMLKGRNSFLVLDSLTSTLIASRNGSPLIVGVSDSSNEVFIASDIPAFLHKTNQVYYLDDGQVVILDKIPEFFDFTGVSINKRLITIPWKSEMISKGDYEHFMIKEIMDQKDSLISAINQNPEEIMRVAEEINNSHGVFFIGCGTAAKVCHIAEYIFSKVADKHINFVTASEFENYRHFLLPETLVIAVSQSGETADVLNALSVAKSKGSKIISIVNSPTSSMARISDYTFLINAGVEKAVASTKATTSQIAVVSLLAYACAGKLREGDRLLVELAGKVNDLLNPRYEERVKALADRLKDSENIFIIGRGINYPLALESAIKIMEVSYIHAQGFAGGELKHGPIALITRGTPVIALVADDDNAQEIISNAMEVKSRGALVIGISPENNPVFDYWLKTPKVNTVGSAIANLIPVQLLAYHLGIVKGFNVDYPRNLAKSVTVK
ncbi:glutamine--fructose-6-phosphate transaminase (isomerizing) [Candidatus Pacearchaeota archaeon CG10_big_fil_rev_8_21_14_0_10_35_13]|nr:MAG: glutamine--fructose-6-phosphate transaminase (isomerizing) [Candidatus Pacearchaeota archaeon CG10_big_fil_rev_8_21_14_0_10_35_13]